MWGYQDGGVGKGIKTKADNLTLIPEPHKLQGENQTLKVVLWSLHTLCEMHIFLNPINKLM